MFNLSEATANWKTQGGWLIAPSNLSWISEGSRLRVRGANIDMSPFAYLGNYVTIGDASTIEDFASIGVYCYIGQDCVVAAAARLGRSVTLGQSVLIDHDAIIGDYATIKEFAHVYPGVLVDNFVDIGELEIVTQNATLANYPGVI